MTVPAPPTILEFLATWAKEQHIIKRSRIPTEKKMLAAIMCSSGYTSRDASKILGGISHVAVHDAFKSVTAALPSLVKKRRLVSIEENMVYLNPETQSVVWLARDADSGEILSFKCSVTGALPDQKRFSDTVLASCTERPLLRVGRGPNFPKSLTSLDLYFQIDTTPVNPTFRQRITSFFLGAPDARE